MRIIFTSCMLFVTVYLFASHNIGGRIEYKNISGLTYEFTVVTYTEANSPAIRDSVELRTGDGNSLYIKRSSSSLIHNGTVAIHYYTDTYTFSSAGFYSISIHDPNRTPYISNISGSVNVPFFSESVLNINAINSSNNSAGLMVEGVVVSEAGKPLKINFAADDVDGDYLYYELITPKQNPVADVPGYFIPAGVQLNPLTGELTWLNPFSPGSYVFTVKISECRNNELIGFTTADIEVKVINPVSSSSQFSGLSNLQTDAAGNYSYTISPGNLVNFHLVYSDTQADSIKVEAYNSTSNGLTILQIDNLSANKDSIVLSWIPDPTDARCAPYLFTIRGNSYIGSTELTQDISILVYVIDQSTTNCGCSIAPTSINNPVSAGFNIAPNPFKDKTIITISENMVGEKFYLEVFDISGRKVKALDGSGKYITIARNGLPAGVYFLHLRNDKGHIEKGKLNIVD